MNTTLVENKTGSLGWLAAWAIASAAGLLLGLAGTLTLLWSVSENFTFGLGERVDGTVFGAVMGLGLGLVLGLAQWVALRLRGESNLRWLGATVLGGVLGGAVTVLFGNLFNEGGQNMLLNAIGFGILGTLLGAFQFGLSRGVATSALWIVASAVGVGIGGMISFGFSDLWVGVLGGGAVYGIVTAAALWWLGKE